MFGLFQCISALFGLLWFISEPLDKTKVRHLLLCNGKWRSDALLVFQFYNFYYGVKKHLHVLPATGANNLTLTVEVTK